jgi:hypothetical protein
MSCGLRLDGRKATVDVHGTLSTLDDGSTRLVSEEVFEFKGAGTPLSACSTCATRHTQGRIALPSKLSALMGAQTTRRSMKDPRPSRLHEPLTPSPPVQWTASGTAEPERDAESPGEGSTQANIAECRASRSPV